MAERLAGRPEHRGRRRPLRPRDRDLDLLDSVDFRSLGGLQEGPDGRMWIATIPFGAPSPDGLLWFDTDTLAPGDQVLVDNGQLEKDVKGVSVDGDGFIWAVTLHGVFKVDPQTYAQQSYFGLDGAYTYSDMTGWGLLNSTCPPPG